MEIIIKGKQHLRLSFLARYGHLCFLSNQIAGFFDQQNLWKESIDVLDFLHGDVHQGR